MFSRCVFKTTFEAPVYFLYLSWIFSVGLSTEHEARGDNQPPVERWEASQHQDTAQTTSTFFAQLPLEYALVLQVPGCYF